MSLPGNGADGGESSPEESDDVDLESEETSLGVPGSAMQITPHSKEEQ